MKPFAFISYHTDSTLSFVEELSHELELLGINHWYAKRDLPPRAVYAEVLPSVIRDCDIVVILLNKFSNNSDQVRNEFLKAYDLKKNILIVKLDECKETNSFSFIRSSVQFLEVYEYNKTLMIKSICKELNMFFSNMALSSDSFSINLTRASNTIDFYAYEEERTRLAVQHHLLSKFAKSPFNHIIDQFETVSILDVGCSTGEFCLNLFEAPEKRRYYVGIDKEEEAIEAAKKQNTRSDVFFHIANCEDVHTLDSTLKNIERELSLDGFDIIFLSMVLLHLKKPRVVLDTLRNHLSTKGKMIILDIDDGLNIAYPDPHLSFQKAVEICEYTSYSGYRKSGREILSYLEEIDMKDIILHRSGLSTVGMNRKERENLFDIYFWFILDDLKIMHKEHPESNIIKADLDWLLSCYDEMKIDFKKSDFFFNIGFMLFSAGN